jgi:hypothetical protein
MLLPDGKALIMDAELYRHTISKSLVIDLLHRPSSNAAGAEEPGQAQSALTTNATEDNGLMSVQSRNGAKDNGRKPSQVNQKRSRQTQADQLSQQVEPDAQNAQPPSNPLQSIAEEDVPAPVQRPDIFDDEEQRDFIKLLDQREFADVTLIVEGGKQIFCHQVILASRSTYFEAIFTNEFSEKESRVVDLSRANITHEQLMRLLRHIYSDTAKVESKHVFDILEVSNDFF